MIRAGTAGGSEPGPGQTDTELSDETEVTARVSEGEEIVRSGFLAGGVRSLKGVSGGGWVSSTEPEPGPADTELSDKTEVTAEVSAEVSVGEEMFRSGFLAGGVRSLKGVSGGGWVSSIEASDLDN